MPYLNVFLLAGCAAVYAASRLVEAVYLAQPGILLDSVSVLKPPGAATAAALGAFVFLAVWMMESMAYRFVLRLPWKQAQAESLRTYRPVSFLLVFGLLFFPGIPLVPMAGWWLLLGASPWVLTLVAAATVHGKASFLLANLRGFPSLLHIPRTSGGVLVFAAGLMAILIALTPTRRFTEPYDARWGTGDEPRYVRLTASLLHDGDADIANAADHVGRRADLFRLGSQVTSWPGSALRALSEVVSSLQGESSEQPSRLGGQVIRGLDGGTYYVYLPGFPLLLVPAMALDSFFFPGMLPLVLFGCLLLGIATAIATARLVEPYLESRLDSYLLAAGLSLTLPIFFYNFQIYPEMTAALCLALMLKTLLGGSIPARGAMTFGWAAALLPWLHTRYYSLWGICILAFAYRAWRERLGWKTSARGIAIPVTAVGLQCLYVFHITGSLLPDTLWVLNGYPRGGHLFNREALSGLYYLLLGREEGLLVYSPLYALAVPGAVAVWRCSRFAGFLSVAVLVPYLWIAASHDLGGAGGWAPATRYWVPVAPVLALWLAAWLGRPELSRARWSALFLGAAASFWIAQGMLAERNLPYDRAAFLSAGVVDVSMALGSVLEEEPWWRRATYPLSLVLSLAAVSFWERRRETGWLGRMAATVVALILVTGAVPESGTARESWIGFRPETGTIRLSPARPVWRRLPDCGTRSPRLRFYGTGEPVVLRMSGAGLERILRVPPTGETEIDVSVRPVLRIGRGAPEEIGLIRLELAAGREGLVVQPVCR